VLGEWYDPEQKHLVREHSRLYEVDVPPDRLDELRELLRRACLTFVQKRIRVVVRGAAHYLREEGTDEPL
jgi:hypothetical protein